MKNLSMCGKLRKNIDTQYFYLVTCTVESEVANESFEPDRNIKSSLISFYHLKIIGCNFRH